MNIIKKVVAIILICLLGQSVAWGASAFTTPAQINVSASLTALANLNTQAHLQDFDKSTPILDVLDARNVPVSVTLPQSQLKFEWVVDSLPETTVLSEPSPRANIYFNDLPFETFNQTQWANCDSGSCNKILDEWVPSQNLKNAISRALLENVTLGQVLNNTVPVNTVLVTVERVWEFSNSNIAVGLMTYNVSNSFNNLKVNLNQTRLLNITGRSLSSLLPMGTPAGIPLTLQWTAETENLGAGSALTLQSTAVEIRLPNGQLLQRIPRPLTSSLRSAGLSGTFPDLVSTSKVVLNDNLSIPGILASNARKQGASSVILRREFTVGTERLAAEVSIPLGSASMADFQITRVDLRFDDGSRVKVVGEDERVSVIADINYLGSGTLEARWNWAPVGAGVPFFRPLPATPIEIDPDAVLGNFAVKPTTSLVREFLNNSQRIQLRSPRLPVDRHGGALITLSITAPDVVFELPVLRYFVVPGSTLGDATTRRLPPMSLLSPNDGILSRASVFRWQPVENSAAYRYECYASEDMKGGMLTGAVVPGEMLEVAVSPLVLDHLHPARRYFCRIVSISPDGRVQAASEPSAMIKTE